MDSIKMNHKTCFKINLYRGDSDEHHSENYCKNAAELHFG